MDGEGRRPETRLVCEMRAESFPERPQLPLRRRRNGQPSSSGPPPLALNRALSRHALDEFFGLLRSERPMKRPLHCFGKLRIDRASLFRRVFVIVTNRRHRTTLDELQAGAKYSAQAAFGFFKIGRASCRERV